MSQPSLSDEIEALIPADCNAVFSFGNLREGACWSCNLNDKQTGRSRGIAYGKATIIEALEAALLAGDHK